jgi:CRISPR-associated protein Cst1
MLTGVGALNFFPAGRSALPVSGPALLALQALPLGGRRSEGKLLVVHCDDNAWTMQFAREYVRRNRTLLELAARDELPDYDGPSPLLEREHAGWDAAKKRPKYPDAKSPQSYVMADLQEVAARRVAGRMRQAHTSVTIYQMSNSGQGPSLAVFHIPGQLVSFLQSVAREPYRHPWSRIVAAAWRATKGEDSPPESSDAPEAPKKRAKTKKERPPLPGGPGRSGNDLYNDLYPVFETGQVDLAAAQKVVRRHLLRDPVKWLDRQQQKLHVPDEAREMIHWDLTQLFLQEVLGMDRQRVDRIRSFADRLAEYIHQSHDKRFFLDLVFASQEWRFRNALTKAQRNEARERRQLLFGLDEYLDVFLADDAAGVARWGLIRDLISIRLVERLFALGFFGAAENLELLTEHEEREEDAPREVAVDD